MITKDKEMVNLMSDYVNSSASNYGEFAKLFAGEHRTLQQQFTKLCIAWLDELANTNNYDARNEASVEFAKSIKDKLVNLPLI